MRTKKNASNDRPKATAVGTATFTAGGDRRRGGHRTDALGTAPKLR